MGQGQLLDREEYIEQAYFFRIFRERLATNTAAQEILERVHEEILSTTRLPLAIQFLATELKHSGSLASGLALLPHYFTPFQAFVVTQTERENLRFGLEGALLVLEREAIYRSEQPTRAGLFVYEFEVLCRNRLGYDEGLEAMARDPFFERVWAEYIEIVRRQVGVVDFAELIYLRSEYYIETQRRLDQGYDPAWPPLFGTKEGKIARANAGKDPLYLFAALQRQLGYPEVPRPRHRDDIESRIEVLQVRCRELEMRVKLLEAETKGQLDLTQFKLPDAIKPAGEE